MFKFQPIYKTTIWGGERIAAYKGLPSTSSYIGESWELSAVEGSETVVSEGPEAGATLRDLIIRHGEQFLGKAPLARHGEEFPLLIKFIDARQDLSIQVHPDDTLAERCYHAKGKTEMWYILDSEPDASLISGFKHPVTPEQYDLLVSEERITEALASHRVKAGDCFFLPAGRVHAIGAGTLLLEIQQSSDITYRIHDYGRMGLDGKPRELHLREAREAIDFSAQDNHRTHYTPTPDGEAELVCCEHFTTELYDLHKSYSLDLTARDSFTAVICLDGRGQLTTDDGSTLPIRQGETVLVAAHHQQLTMTPDKTMRLLTTHL